MVGFDIQVHLPRPSDRSSPVFIKSFETDLTTSFPHVVDSDISSHVGFGSVRFKTTNAPISVTVS